MDDASSHPLVLQKLTNLSLQIVARFALEACHDDSFARMIIVCVACVNLALLNCRLRTCFERSTMQKSVIIASKTLVAMMAYIAKS